MCVHATTNASFINPIDEIKRPHSSNTTHQQLYETSVQLLDSSVLFLPLRSCHISGSTNRLCSHVLPINETKRTSSIKEAANDVCWLTFPIATTATEPKCELKGKVIPEEPSQIWCEDEIPQLWAPGILHPGRPQEVHETNAVCTYV